MASRLGFRNRLSVGAKIGILLSVMVVVAAVNVGVVYYYQSQSETLGNSMNYAGEQRMLTQEMLVHANELADSDSDEAREDLIEAMEQYENNLETLREGGEIDGHEIPPAPESTHEELAQQETAWEDYEERLNALLEAEPGSQQQLALAYVVTNNEHLQDASDETSQAFAAAAESQIQFMQQVLLGLFAINVVVFLLGVVVAYRGIGRPASELAAVADDFANGEFDTEIGLDVEEVNGQNRDAVNDELQQLVMSFAEMQSYLTTVSSQAEALSRQEFDAEILEKDVPGEFGRSIAEMRSDLQELVENLEAVNRQLERKAEEYQAVMRQAAEGDLTQRMDPDTENEAMAEIGTSFNRMMDETEATLVELQEFADEVAVSSQEVTTGAEEVEAASRQVTESIQEISAGAERQEGQLQEVTNEMQDLSGMIEEVAASADEVAEKSQTVARTGRQGSESAADAIEEMNAIEAAVDDRIEQVESLADEIEEVNEIAELIGDIAEKTNLLALNASIEAARAGEAGDGFAVVADEVKSLAEEAADGSEEIQDLIDTVQESATETVESTREMGQRVSNGRETVDDALTALESIADDVEDVNTSIQEISQAADDQAVSTEEVVSILDDVTGVAETTNTEAADVSAAAEQQTSALSEVSANAQQLAGRAEDLERTFEEFVVAETDSEVDRPEANADGPAAVSADGGVIHNNQSTSFEWNDLDERDRSSGE